MWRGTAHRLLALLLSVALATGLTVRVVQAGGMEMTAAAMAADMPMHGKCDGCAGNEKSVAPSACSAYCGSIIGLPATAVAFASLPAEMVAPGVEPAATGHAVPPDPYPPRPIVLN
jgi:hypothetical protein